MNKPEADPSPSPAWPPAGSGGYYKVPEAELNTAAFDLPPPDPAHTPRKYVICSTQRSGSFLLCRQLVNAGIGVPHEYFNRLHIGELCRRWGIDRSDAGAYIRTLLARRTTPNGVWGTKLQWDQHLNTRPHLDAAILGDARFIFLYRSDLCAQAVSLHMSMVTGRWGFDDTESTRYSDITLGDMDHVAYCLRKIEHENHAWRAFMVERGVVPLAICYEDLTEKQGSFVEGIASYLGLGPADYRVPPPEGRENHQSPELSEIRRQLLQTCREMLGST